VTARPSRVSGPLSNPKRYAIPLGGFDDEAVPAEVFKGTFILFVGPILPVMVKAGDATFQCQPCFGVTDEFFVIGRVRPVKDFQCLAKFTCALVDQQTAGVSTHGGGIFKGVEFEMTRRPAVSVDGRGTVWVPNEELVNVHGSQ